MSTRAGPLLFCVPQLRLVIALMTLVPAVAAAQVAPSAPEPASADWSAQDWAIFDSKVRWAATQHLDTLPVGEAIAQLGETFVGTPYRAATLEIPGPETLVVNLHELDCVTFVETVLALTEFVRRDGVAALADSAAARTRYEGYLRSIRYRDGVINGYASRLHYFSDWLAENARAGHLIVVSAELTSVEDARPIDFMSSHAGKYPALADSATLATIILVENRLNTGPPRRVIPKDSIAGLVSQIRDGDIIAAASTVAGLDITHTGFALWRDGQLHLMHAPLTGQPLEISPLPLAERIQKIQGQWGIMIARVTEPWPTTP